MVRIGDLLEDVKKEAQITEDFTILEELDFGHLEENDDRTSAAWDYAKMNFPGYRIHGNNADYDRMNGLTVVVIGDKKYLVYNQGTEMADVVGEYFGTLRYEHIRCWTDGVPTRWGKTHLHLYKQ